MSEPSPHRSSLSTSEGDRPEAVFVPQPPEPLPDAWPACYDDVAAAAPPPPVDDPPRRKPILPLVVAVLATAASLAVAHHWWGRVQAPLAVGVATPERAGPPADEPFSLRAAWRNIARPGPEAALPSASPAPTTPVISVLDEPAPAPAAPAKAMPPPSRPPSAAALLAERMATAAADEQPAAPEPPPPLPRNSAATRITPPPAPVAPPPPPKVVSTPADTPTEPEAIPRIATPRAPGMVGLGGPPQRESLATPEADDMPLPRRKPLHRAAPPRAKTHAARTPPRKPLQRPAAPPPARRPAAEPPSPVHGMTIFNGLGRAMP
jgi:hypothetical protein